MTLQEFLESRPPGEPCAAMHASPGAAYESVGGREQVHKQLAYDIGLDTDRTVLHDLGRQEPLGHVLFVATAKPGTWQGVSRQLLADLLALLPVEHRDFADGSLLLLAARPGHDERLGVRCHPAHSPRVSVMSTLGLAEAEWPHELFAAAVRLRHALDPTKGDR